MNKNQIVLIIVGVLMIIGLIAGFYYWLQYEKSKIPEEKDKLLIEGEEMARKMGTIEEDIVPEDLEEFDKDFCQGVMSLTLLPSAKEYYTSYNIDGSEGVSVRWIASEEPPKQFSPFELPYLFFVYFDDKFEGCGRRQEMGDIEKIEDYLKTELKNNLYPCDSKNLYLVQGIKEKYTELDLFLYKTDEKLINSMIFMGPEYKKENILSNLGCSL